MLLGAVAEGPRRAGALDVGHRAAVAASAWPRPGSPRPARRPTPASAIATSSVVRTTRASPEARSTRRATASSSSDGAVGADGTRGEHRARSSGGSGSKRHSVERLSSGALRAKNGFSVVAPMRTTTPSSTPCSRASCCALLKRCTSSRNRIVPRPSAPSARRASSSSVRTSFTPGVDRRQRPEPAGGVLGEQAGDGRLARSGRPEEDRRAEPVVLDEGAQRRARAEEMALADDVVEGLRAQAGRQRRPRVSSSSAAASNRSRSGGCCPRRSAGSASRRARGARRHGPGSARAYDPDPELGQLLGPQIGCGPPDMRSAPDWVFG